MKKEYFVINSSDYHKNFSVGEENYLCLSKADFKKLRKVKDVRVVGEAKFGNKEDIIANLWLQRGETQRLLGVSRAGTNRKAFSHITGYVEVGAGEYIALLASNLSLYVVLMSLVLLVSAVAIASVFGNMNKEPVEPSTTIGEVIPPIETDAVTEGPVTEVQAKSDKGGHSNIEYSRKAQYAAGDLEVTMYFKNGASSNHDAVVSMYVINGDEEVLVAQSSGKVPIGYSLYNLNCTENIKRLTSGEYEAKYVLEYYNANDEKSVVRANLTDITLSVF